MDPTTNRINLTSGGGSEQFILELDTNTSVNPTGDMYLYGVDYNSSGDAIVAGYTNTEDSGNDNASLICKINKTGTSVDWSKHYQQSGHTEQLTAVRVNRDESGEPIYVCGSTGNYVTSTYGSNSDATLKKFAQDGTTTWQVQWGNTAYDQWSALDFDSSNNVYLTGTAYPWQSGIAISSFNSSGVHQWGIKKEMATTESAPYIVTDSNGDLWWGGRDNHSTSDGWLGKYNTSGTRLNSWKFSNASDLFYGLDTDASGNVYCMIDSNNTWIGTSGNISGNSGTIMQMNANGNWTWAMQSGGNAGANYGYGICCDKTVSQGDIYGYSHASPTLTGTSHNGVYIIKRGYSGSTIWSRMFTKANKHVTFSGGNLSIRCDGEYLYIVGTVQSSGQPVRPWLIKYPVDGSATGTFGDWTITAMTDGQNNYHAHDNNFLSSWSFWAGGEYSVTYDQTTKSLADTESTSTIITGNKENL